MKLETHKAAGGVNILVNDHYVAMPYDCSELTSLAADGVIPAGTIVPANDATAVGVLLQAVVLADNPNGTAVIHGFINADKLPEKPSADTALKQITFM